MKSKPKKRHKPHADSPFRTVRELAARYHVCENTIRAWDRQGLLIRATLPTKTVRYHISNIMKFEKEHQPGVSQPDS